MPLNPLSITSDITTFFSMTKAILQRKYKMPWGTFIWAILCMVYCLSPIDVLPDVLPILGITDDGAFIVFILSLLHKDIAAYKEFQKKQDNIIEAEVIETTGEKK